MWFTYPIIREYGGYYYGQYNGTYNPLDIGLNNEGMLAYVDKIREEKNKGLVLQSPIGMESHIVAQFAKGNVAMILYGLWSSSTFRSAGVRYGLAKLPAHADGSASLPLATVVGFVVNEHSPNLQQAKDFLFYMSRNENQQALVEAGNRWELKTGSRNPACLSVIKSEYIQSDEILSSLSQIGAECEPFPNIPEGRIWYNYTDTVFKAIFFGDADGNAVDAGQKLDDLAASIAADVKR
jgi:arabinogalactan oligomer/maltooligosaccharide transport system substrate-binding protein